MMSNHSVDNTAMIHNLCGEFLKHNQIDPIHYENLDVKRGLRNADGTGVMAGITQIGDVQGYYYDEHGKRPPCPDA